MLKTNAFPTRAAPSVENPLLAQEDTIHGLESPPTTPREQLILFSLSERELYGLELQKAISECGGPNGNLTLGTIYPILRSLENKGLITGRWGDEDVESRSGARRRYYQLTSLGETSVSSILDYHQKLLNWGKPEPNIIWQRIAIKKASATK
jgi:PadR family transcriptional regulator, regulatory protein PadR